MADNTARKRRRKVFDALRGQPKIMTVRDLRDCIDGMPDDAKLVVQTDIRHTTTPSGGGYSTRHYHHVSAVDDQGVTSFSGRELVITTGEEFDY